MLLYVVNHHYETLNRSGTQEVENATFHLCRCLYLIFRSIAFGAGSTVFAEPGRSGLSQEGHQLAARRAARNGHAAQMHAGAAFPALAKLLRLAILVVGSRAQALVADR